MNSQLIISSALRTIELEAQSVNGLTVFIDESFVAAVENIAAAKGRVVISGIGKSAVVAQKICGHIKQHRNTVAFYACCRCYSWRPGYDSAE